MRLQSPIFQKIRLGEYFVELDKKFSSEYKASAVDVDIFAQAAQVTTNHLLQMLGLLTNDLLEAWITLVDQLEARSIIIDQSESRITCN